MDVVKIQALLEDSQRHLNTAQADITQALKLLNEPPPEPPETKTLRQMVQDTPPGGILVIPSGHYVEGGPIILEKNITIEANGALVSFAGSKDTGLFQLTSKVTQFELQDMTGFGANNANYLVRSENAAGIRILRCETRKHPTTGLGAGIFIANGVKKVDILDCQTEFTTVYSFYCGGSETSLNNQDITLRGCEWGKSDSHCMRTYGVKNMTIDLCIMHNPKSASGRQAIKVMNGENITITSTTFDGTTRFGRDINDPSSYTLKNVLIKQCDFKDWTRTDSDNVRYEDCTVKADNSGFCIQPKGKVSLTRVKATYVGSGGKFASDTQNIILKKECTFNGQPV